MARRRPSGYVAVIEVAGRQRKKSARTYDEARRLKRGSESDRDRGLLQPNTAITFVPYLDEWVERYHGQGRGFRENTRDEYRRLIQAHHYFSKRLKLTDVTTYELARFVDWLRDEDEQGRRITDSTIANVLMPLRSALATATREGLIRHNLSRGLRGLWMSMGAVKPGPTPPKTGAPIGRPFHPSMPLCDRAVRPPA